MRIGTLRGKFGEIGDARLVVMAALTVCDELLDATARIRGLEEERDGLSQWTRLASRERVHPMPRLKVGREEKVALAIVAALWPLTIGAVAYIMLGH